MVDLGCITVVERGKAKQLAGQDIDTFDLDWLQAGATMQLYTSPGAYPVSVQYYIARAA